MAPQTLQVLLCVQCKAFQVHIVKKAKKWDCKVCGIKQSHQKVFGTGTGAECRYIVQKLNEARGEIEQNNKEQSEDNEIDTEEAEDIEEEEEGEDKPLGSSLQPTPSKWAEYLEGNIDAITESGHSTIPNHLY